MKVLFDTHVFLWAMGVNKKLSRNTIDLLTDKDTETFLSAASSWEIAIKYSKGSLILPDPPRVFIPSSISIAGIKQLPIIVRETLLVGELPLHHRDPFDRMLIAQARAHNLIIMTEDRMFDAYDVETITP